MPKPKDDDGIERVPQKSPAQPFAPPGTPPPPPGPPKNDDPVEGGG